jgi:PleD family two-component response regulator
LKKLRRDRMTNSEDRPEEGTGFGLKRILNKNLFFYLLDLEVKRARRYQNFYCILLLKLKRLSNHDDENSLQSCVQMVANFLTGEIRESDIMCSLGENNLAVLLPYADISAGGHVKSRLEGNLKYCDFKSMGCEVIINQVCFPSNGTNAIDLLKKALGVEPL